MTLDDENGKQYGPIAAKEVARFWLDMDAVLEKAAPGCPRCDARLVAGVEAMGGLVRLSLSCDPCDLVAFGDESADALFELWSGPDGRRLLIREIRTLVARLEALFRKPLLVE